MKDARHPKRRAYIMQGPPGAGKTTLAKEIVNGKADAVIASADDFFMVNGHYHFDPTKLGLAHDQAFTKFKNAVDAQVWTVVADNTNVRKRDYQRYVDYAASNGYEVVMVRITGVTPEECHRRGVHGVPLSKIQQMAKELEG